jgi:cytochrome c-type biogenesis protein CcmH
MKPCGRVRAPAQLCAALLYAGLLWASLAAAIDATPPLPDPLLQQRYYQLTHELRCMQCQSEALADSSVSLAADLRLQVRELLLAGQSDDQIRDHMVARYGEFILFRPRMTWRNAWLWAAPTLMMVLGCVVAWRIRRARARLVDAEQPGSNGDSLLP